MFTPLEQEIIDNLKTQDCLNIETLTAMSKITRHPSRIGIAVRSLEEQKVIRLSRFGSDHTAYILIN